MTSEAIEAICTWIPRYSGLLISNMRSHDPQGFLEAAIAMEATMASEAVGGNMDMDTRVIKVADLKSEDLRSNDLRGCLEAAMASDTILGNMHMDTRVIKVAYFKSEVI